MDTAVAAPKKRGRFGKEGVPNPGRPDGAVNRYTRVIKEAVLIAAEEHGRNGNGKDKLIGFMRKVIDEDLRTFCMMMARAMPLQVEQRVEQDKPQDIVYASMEEVKREMASKGISFEVMLKMVRTADDNGMMDGLMIDNEGNDVGA